MDGVLTEMSECLVYGLYVVFNSTEINAIPVPDVEVVREMGRKLLKSKDYSEANCNLILEGYCG